MVGVWCGGQGVRTGLTNRAAMMAEALRRSRATADERRGGEGAMKSVEGTRCVGLRLDFDGVKLQGWPADTIPDRRRDSAVDAE
jgi:hypothetical protein